MTSPFMWIETLGGPHVILPEENLHHWRGSEGWKDHIDPSDTSDYARACRVDSWLGLLGCGGGDALVLSEDFGPVAWLQGEDQSGGLLIQWLGFDEEKDILLAINSPKLAEALGSADAESIEFATGPSGALRLFDAAERGDDISGESAKLRVRPGTYMVRAGYLETENLMIVVRRFCLDTNT